MEYAVHFWSFSNKKCFKLLERVSQTDPVTQPRDAGKETTTGLFESSFKYLNIFNNIQCFEIYEIYAKISNKCE